MTDSDIKLCQFELREAINLRIRVGRMLESYQRPWLEAVYREVDDAVHQLQRQLDAARQAAAKK